MTVCWNRPDTTGGSDIVGYIVEKRDRAGVRWTKCNKRRVTDLRFRVTGLTEDHEYEFRVSAENAAGVGNPSPPTPYLKACDPTFEPGCPTNAHVIDTTKDSVSLAWHRPIYDGGCEIQGYAVEITKADEEEWTICTPPSGPLESEPVIARNPFTTPSAPSTPEASAITRDSIVLTWERPENNGGAEIEGYVLEKRDKDGIRWTKCNKKRLNDLRFRCTGLTEGHSYEFRVSAENAAGVGKPSAPTPYIKACDKLEAPEIELDADLRKMVNVRATATLRLFVIIRGKPEPEVRWSKADGTLNERAQIEVTSSYTMLVIENVDRFDTGKYVLTLENLSGSKSAFINVRVLDSPSAPTNLEVKDVKRNSVSLSWEPPLIDGGAKISHYIVEKREQKRMAFTSVCTNCVRNSYIISDLQEGGRYYFRVLAVNELGVGLPASTDQVKVSEAPLPPDDLKIDVPFKESPEINMKDFPHNTVYVRAGSTLKCEIPLTGCPLPKVTLSKDNVLLKSTMRFNSEVTPDSIKITLRESIAGDSGRYDITASNSSGTTKSFVNIVVLDRPSAPLGPVELFDVTEDSVSLKWLPPAYDGGSPITNYILQKRETTTANWMDVSSAVARCTMKIMKLTTGLEYQFRIRAENRYGISEHIDSPTVTVSLPYSKHSYFASLHMLYFYFCVLSFHL
uniref:Titin n=1 Tax=Amphiprion percula TaxID=161767 RepID=A0A3P8SSB5_AMPPE